MYDNPDRGYRTTIPFTIKHEHKVDGVVTSTCDLIKRGKYVNGTFVEDPNGGSVIYNSASACAGKHDVQIMYANLTEQCKLNVIDYLIKNLYFNSGSYKNDYVAKNVLLQSSLPDYRDPYYTSDKDASGNYINHPDEMLIPEGALQAYNLLFQRLKERECRVLFRVGYHGVQKNLTLSSATATDKDNAYTSEEVMLAHIEQLGSFFKTCESASVVSKISSGFIGSGGEMASNYQWPQFDTTNYNNIMKAVIEDICIPNSISYTVRMPGYWENFVAAYPDYKRYVGFNNDAIFGETDELGYVSGCWQYGHSSSNCSDAMHSATCKDPTGHWWELACNNAAFTAQSGEMFHNLNLKYLTCTKTGHENLSCYAGNQRIPTGYNVIKELAHMRYSTFSQWNGLMEGGFNDSVKYYQPEQGRYSLNANGEYVADENGGYVRILTGWPSYTYVGAGNGNYNINSNGNMVSVASGSGAYVLADDQEYRYYIYCSVDEVKYDASGNNVGTAVGTHVYVSPASVMSYWMDNETLTMEWLDENGIIYDPAWFLDDNGNVVKRSTFEFIRDHLGYKLVAQDLIIKGQLKANREVYANLALKNYGFAAAFGLKSSLVILDSNGNEVSKVEAGDPSKWYSHDPYNYKSTEVLLHTVSANITLPSEAGTYRLALLLENETGDTARLSNANANGFSYTADSNKTTKGYNILYTFNVQ